MGDDDECDPPRRQVRREPADALDVEVVGGLVEDDEVEPRSAPRRARPGASRHRTGHRWAARCRRWRARRGRRGPGRRRPTRGRRRTRRGRCRAPSTRPGSGRAAPVRHPQATEAADPAALDRAVAGDHVEQGRLPAAVEADDADPVAALDAERDAVEQDAGGVTGHVRGDVLQVEQVLGQLRLHRWEGQARTGGHEPELEGRRGRGGGRRPSPRCRRCGRRRPGRGRPAPCGTPPCRRARSPPRRRSRRRRTGTRTSAPTRTPDRRARRR